MVAPVTLTLLMVAVAVPVFVSVICCDVLLPTATDPKLSEVEDAVIVAAVPVPETVTVAGELLALLTNETDPDTAPVVVGANVTFAVTLAPAATVVPALTPVTLIPAPEVFTAEIVAVALPEFVSVTEFEELLLTTTFPNARLVTDGFSAMV